MLIEDADSTAPKQRIHDFISRQFAAPEGWGGVAVATVMRLINWLPYRGAIGLLDVSPDANVLEIGHGPGFGLTKLTQLASNGLVVGIDRSLTMTRLARSRNASAILTSNLSLKQGTFERIPLHDASMDAVLAVNVLYFVDPISLALDEARRVLRPGGTLVIYVTDNSHMSWLQFVGRDTKHVFDEANLLQILRATDFGEDLIDIRNMWLPFRFRGLLAKVTKRPDVPFSPPVKAAGS